MNKPVLTRADRLNLSAESAVDLRTIDSAYSGKAVREATRERLTKAAKKLKLPEPPTMEDK